MKTIIEVSLKNEGDNKSTTTFSVVLDRDQLAQVVASKGLDAANSAIEGFVNKFTAQFKQNLGQFLNK